MAYQAMPLPRLPFRDRMRRIAERRLGTRDLIEVNSPFLPVVATEGNTSTPNLHDEIEEYGTSTARVTTTLGSIIRFAGNNSGPAVLQGRGTGAGSIKGNPIVNMQSSKVLMGARVRTPSPGTFVTDTMIQFGLSDISGSSKNMGLGCRGAAAGGTTHWSMWLPNGGAFTVAQSIASSKAFTSTQEFVDAYFYLNSSIRFSVDGEAEVTAPFTQSDLVNAAGTWKIQVNRLGGAGTDIMEVDDYVVYVAPVA